ncbi:MAG: enoyl-CoA hydratase/isomerase family protein [Novosphingobium sp.]|nr:enoyl-CoA hydratase/isomerase family protein [Novosphingobium sp.]
MSEETASEPLLFEIIEDHVALVRFNRPQARNAVDIATAQALNAAVERVEADPAIRVAVLASAAPGMFCAGADLKVIAAGRVQELRPNDAGFAGFVDAVRDKPWIAAVDGPALGGGTELCLACDMIVATTGTRFGLPEVKRGLMANGGGNSRLARVLPRNIALELIATGEAFSAQFAADHGMVNRLVEPDGLMDAAMALARMIVANAPVAVTESLRVARQSADRSDAELRRLSRERNRIVLDTEDAKEGPRAFAEKRAPVWQGR